MTSNTGGIGLDPLSYMGINKATSAETVTGTDAYTAVTPAGLTARLAAPGAIGATTPAAVSTNNLKVKEGTNQRMGTATLVAGTVTVSNTSVTANTRIFLTVQSLGTVAAPKAIAVTARVAGTSFTITSADNTDTSVVAWLLIEPAA